SVARQRYRRFVEKGIAQGRRDDLAGGGLIRSAGGWSGVKAMRRADTVQKSDERILGNGQFVERVLREAEERMERCYRMQALGVDLGTVTRRVSEVRLQILMGDVLLGLYLNRRVIPYDEVYLKTGRAG
ncbi:MAG: hypothetical protein L7F78_28000, partial [Syntrophales bacterium LBB04]|nr:hypothetical protein [Syntrophales bacterium LBB04]